MTEVRPRFNAYIDGFNLYRGLLKSRPQSRWLDLRSFAQYHWAELELANVYYFTSRTKQRYAGDMAPARQHAYLRALESTGVSIILGKFEKNTDWLRLGSPRHSEAISPALPDPKGQVQAAFDAADESAHPDSLTARVWKFGEKGTDVNLASYLLQDVLKRDLTHAMVVTGDSDLATPIRMSVESGAIIKTLMPNPRHPSLELRHASTEARFIDPEIIEKSQFPRSVITQRGGNITRPLHWD